MIFVSQGLKVNESGSPSLTPQQIWDGLVLKANNALPFVPSITQCDVIERYGDNIFDREIVFRDQPFTERITLMHPNRVVFTRIKGNVLGTIANEIIGDGAGLELRFSYALVVEGLEPGSSEESNYADGMKADYLKAVEATVAAIRQLALESD